MTESSVRAPLATVLKEQVALGSMNLDNEVLCAGPGEEPSGMSAFKNRNNQAMTVVQEAREKMRKHTLPFRCQDLRCHHDSTGRIETSLDLATLVGRPIPYRGKVFPIPLPAIDETVHLNLDDRPFGQVGHAGPQQNSVKWAMRAV